MRFRLRPSRWLTLLLVAAHGAAILAVFSLPVLWAQWVLAFLILANLGYVVWQEWRALDAAVVVAVKAEQVWLETRGGEEVVVRLLPGSVVTPWLTVLRFGEENGRRTWGVVLLPDSLAGSDFRRLRVWLRWGLSERDSWQA